jgi:signal transduction histidine kinase
MLTYARYRPALVQAQSAARLVEQTLDLVAGHARRAGVRVALEDRSDGAQLEGDLGQIQQVVVNLLLNAVDATPRGSDVRVCASTEDSDLVLDVRDEGPGVPPEDRERIFEPFFTTKRLGEGTGLGLAISKEIVEAHGGTLRLEESPRGAHFRVRLPPRARAVS